jgi:hypothetical protein
LLGLLAVFYFFILFLLLLLFISIINNSIKINNKHLKVQKEIRCKTIRSKRTPKYLDLIQLSRKSNKLRTEKTMKIVSLSHTKNLKPKQFRLSCKQKHNTQQKYTKNNGKILQNPWMSNFRGVNVKAGEIHAPARSVPMEEQKIV